MREIEATSNIIVRLQIEVIAAEGDERLAGMTVRDRSNGTIESLATTALFVLIGGAARTQWLPTEVERDDGGYITTGRDVGRSRSEDRDAPTRPPLALETSVPGVFAAGDVRARSIKRVASAVGDGATAIRLVHDYLAEVDDGDDSGDRFPPNRV